MDEAEVLELDQWLERHPPRRRRLRRHPYDDLPRDADKDSLWEIEGIRGVDVIWAAVLN